MNSASTVLRGVSDNREMVEILWHRRETRRQTEKTNIDLNNRDSNLLALWPSAHLPCLFKMGGSGKLVSCSNRFQMLGRCRKNLPFCGRTKMCDNWYAF